MFKSSLSSSSLLLPQKSENWDKTPVVQKPETRHQDTGTEPCLSILHPAIHIKIKMLEEMSNLVFQTLEQPLTTWMDSTTHIKIPYSSSQNTLDFTQWPTPHLLLVLKPALIKLYWDCIEKETADFLLAANKLNHTCNYRDESKGLKLLGSKSTQRLL